MKCHQCQIASRMSVALGDEARAAMHRRCPGAYRTPDGEAHLCDCDCHRPESGSFIVDVDEAAKGPLPVLDPSLEGSPAGEDSRPKKGQKAPQRGTHVGRRCECCGAASRSRFLPGHDAKLKSKLFRAAKTGSLAAVLELEVRDWLRLVKYEEIPDDGLEYAVTKSKAAKMEGRSARLLRDLVLDRIGGAELTRDSG